MRRGECQGDFFGNFLYSLLVAPVNMNIYNIQNFFFNLMIALIYPSKAVKPLSMSKPYF